MPPALQPRCPQASRPTHSPRGLGLSRLSLCPAQGQAGACLDILQSLLASPAGAPSSQSAAATGVHTEDVGTTMSTSPTLAPGIHTDLDLVPESLPGSLGPGFYLQHSKRQNTVALKHECAFTITAASSVHSCGASRLL